MRHQSLGFGGSSVDRCVGQELLKAIAPLGVEASLRALEDLSADGTAQRVALSRKLKQLVYEERKAFEQYDAIAGLVHEGLATAQREIVSGRTTIEVVRIRISDAGLRVIER